MSAGLPHASSSPEISRMFKWTFLGSSGEDKRESDLEREAVVWLVPLPPLRHLAVAVPPQAGPALPAQTGVLRCGLVQAGATATVGLQLPWELNQAPQQGGNLAVPSILASSLERGNKFTNYKGSAAGEKSPCKRRRWNVESFRGNL